ncbi:MAG: carboxypeptidase regulatory-like domain-containing protein [Myxococcales bacterium]|jgi:hypothetical protein
MKRLIGTLAVVVVCACGSTPVDSNGDGIADGDPRTPDSVTAVAPSTPKGKVSGRVVDAQGKALAGVAVLLSGTEAATATTDAAGLFSIDKVTAGSKVGVVFTLDGYAPAWASAIIPGSTGNFPLNDGEVFVGPIAMIPIKGELGFHVVGWDGALVAKPAGLLDFTPGFLDLSYSAAVGVGSITAESTGANGVLTFGGVPRLEEAARLASLGVIARYSLYIPPVIEGETMRYAGTALSFTAEELLTDPWTRTIVLDPPDSPAALSIEATNVNNLVDCPSLGSGNLVPRAGPLYVVFNQHVSPGALAQVFVDVQDASKYEPVAVNAEVLSVGNQLKIVPGGAIEGFQEGLKYFLALQVASRDNPGAAPLHVVAPFFGGSLNDPRPLGNVTVQFVDSGVPGVFNPGEALEIVFERNIGRGGSGGFSVPLYFNYDLDGSGTIGDGAGELGSDAPYCVEDAETVPPVSGAQKSGYSRWASASTTTGTQPAGSSVVGLPALGIPNATEVTVLVALSEAHRCSGVLQTVWGENLLADVEVNLSMRTVPAP